MLPEEQEHVVRIGRGLVHDAYVANSGAKRLSNENAPNATDWTVSVTIWAYP